MKTPTTFPELIFSYNVDELNALRDLSAKGVIRYCRDMARRNKNVSEIYLIDSCVHYYMQSPIKIIDLFGWVDTFLKNTSDSAYDVTYSWHLDDVKSKKQETLAKIEKYKQLRVDRVIFNGIYGKTSDYFSALTYSWHLDDVKSKKQEALAKIEKYKQLRVDRVIFNKPATIVYWRDGTKTVVKCNECCDACEYRKHRQSCLFDEEKGLALCFMKKSLGNKGNYNDVFKEYIPEKAKPLFPEVEEK